MTPRQGSEEASGELHAMRAQCVRKTKITNKSTWKGNETRQVSFHEWAGEVLHEGRVRLLPTSSYDSFSTLWILTTFIIRTVNSKTSVVNNLNNYQVLLI